MESWAPLNIQETWDKSGWQIKFHNKKTESVTLAMDVTPRVIKEAIENNSKLILTHHPFIFQGIQSLDMNTVRGKMVQELISHEISVYSAHTNLDKTKGGVNDQWADILNLKNVEVLHTEEEIGVIGDKEISLENLLEELKGLGLRSFKGYGKKIEDIQRIAVLGGSGSDYISQAKAKGADLLITGDVTHHKGQEAYEESIMVLDLGHYESEKFILKRLKDKLQKEYPHLKIFISEGCDFVFDL